MLFIENNLNKINILIKLKKYYYEKNSNYKGNKPNKW